MRKELPTLPWAELTSTVLDFVVEKAPKGASVVDLMCGPGYLLGKINKSRPDLSLNGVDIDKSFIAFAKKKYKKIQFTKADALKWSSKEKYDLILCTGGLHHLPYSKQADLVKRMSSLLKSNGICIIADTHIDNYSNETQRRAASARLGYGYLNATIERGASPQIIKEAIDILHNDVLGFEYKTSVKNNSHLFRKYFSKMEIHKTWPQTKTDYGDYFFVLKK
jgi:trans-aconitate methyltransferase